MILFLRMAILCWSGCALVSAQEVAPPFVLDKASSADLIIILKKGTVLPAKAFLDGDKVRAELSLNGMAMTTIIRKDEQKAYQLMPAQKLAMEMNFDPAKFKGYTAVEGTFGPKGKFEALGTETIDGIVCTKYKVSSDTSKHVFYFWLNTALKTPVEMTSEDGALTVKWKSYKAGPQDPALFEVPADYQVMPMQGMPGMSGGGGE